MILRDYLNLILFFILKFNPFRVTVVYVTTSMGFHPWLFKLNPYQGFCAFHPGIGINLNNLRCKPEV